MWKRIMMVNMELRAEEIAEEEDHSGRHPESKSLE